MQRADDNAFAEHILPFLIQVIDGSGQNFDSTVATMISKGRWIFVERILLLDGKRLWTVDDISIDRETLHHLAEGRWREVGIVLTQGVGNSLHRWMMHTASSHANSTDLITYILPHCADDQLDSVLTTLVERRLWRAVADVLKRNVSDSCKQSAVLKACMLCDYNDNDDNDDTDDIYYTDDTDDTDSLDSSSSDVWDVYAVYEHQLHCTDQGMHIDNYLIIKEILARCADSQLDSVLKALADRGMWQAVGEMLNRCITDYKTTEQKTCEHCNSAELYFNNYSVATTDSSIERPTTFHCTDNNLDPLSPGPIRKDVCMAVRNVGGTEVSDAQRRASIQTAFQYADTYCLKQSILPYYVYDSIHSALKMLASRECWSALIELLHYCCIDTLSTWALGKDTTSRDEVFWGVVKNPCDGVKGLTPAMWRSVTWSGLQRSLKQLEWDTPLCEVLRDSLLAIVREIWLSGRREEVDFLDHRVMDKSFSTVENLHQRVKPVLMECETNIVSGLLPCIKGLNTDYTQSGSEKSLHFELWFIKVLVLQYYKRKAWTQMTETILIVLTTVPVVPDVHSVALRVMLRHKRWDVITHACLSGVCEQDRRHLFQAAVKQRQWSAVKRWADHTLYDDQRLWALGEARQEKRWDVYLKLADHGLSEWERVGVLFRVAMHADWKLLRHMLNTVTDVSDMIDLLRITPGVLSKLGARLYEQRMNQLSSFEKSVEKDTNALKTLKTMAKRRKWWVVLHNIRHKPNLQHVRRALKAAVSSEVWHVVMQLVRLETDVTRRDSLFRDMVRLRQWAVCRELLEQGVSQQLCLEHISELIEHSQWTLVAMVMGCAIDDATRKKIMHRAMMMREGSVVWECINKLQTRLSVEEREDMFQLAFNREVWQAVKPLIEEKDETGIRHRDIALLEAIEQHQWDVVDHCQRHHADINMKDDDDHTPIHRAARKEDWEAVKELTVRDGDPNLLDFNDRSVLQRAIRAKQWNLAKLLIQYHGDIHQVARQGSTPPHMLFDDRHYDTRTPLQMLIDARQGEVIESTLMWCPDQWKGVNKKKRNSFPCCVFIWLVQHPLLPVSQEG
ncbi:uncharacterized protein [Littorina saxatilis]|uniref:uncharacterized protein n=1 Tax=Littorina saxatilis TaxID=31220 RepID=UPI0038B66966